MKILLIEDEQPAARQLTKLIKQYNDAYTIIDTLDSVESAVRWLQHYPAPDLAFLDIQLADGLSFDIFQQVAIPCPVVFTTAFDQFAIKAFKVNAIDYLLKPVDFEELKSVFEKVATQKQPTALSTSILEMFKKPHYKDRFLIKSGQSISFVQTQTAAYFLSEDGITFVQTLQGKKHIIEPTLDELEKLLDPALFFRINRKMVVNLNNISRINAHFNGRLKIELSPPCQEDVFVSRERVNEFKVWLGA